MAQSTGSKSQSSSSGGKGQPVKPKPKPVPTSKGSNKGKGRGKGYSKKKTPGYSSGQGNRPSAKECNGEEGEEVPEDDPENQDYGECPEETADPLQHYEEEEEQAHQPEVPPTETIKSV